MRRKRGGKENQETREARWVREMEYMRREEGKVKQERGSEDSRVTLAKQAAKVRGISLSCYTNCSCPVHPLRSLS